MTVPDGAIAVALVKRGAARQGQAGWSGTPLLILRSTVARVRQAHPPLPGNTSDPVAVQ